MTTIHYLQHVPFEGPGMIADWATRRGLELLPIPIWEEGTVLPTPEDVEVLIVLGGPMSVHDEEALPWLMPEKAFLRAVMDSGKPVLGICLGAQLIAEALGAEVKGNPVKEIGWFPIRMKDEALGHPIFADFPPELKVLHWHGETFDLPEGTIPIASSEACANQGFIWEDRVIGLQFHLEAGEQEILRLVEGCAEEFQEVAPTIQSPEQMVIASGEVETRKWLERILVELFQG